MRKLILDLLLFLLIFGAGWIVIKGVNVSGLEIDSYSEIAAQNNELDKLIQEANNQKDNIYTRQKSILESSYKTLVSEKESYQELLDAGVDSNGIPLSKIQEYEIEKIWITLGNYAKEKGVDLKLEIKVNNSVSGTYDLNFTVDGSYSGIVDFIRSIQGDNTLVFKIDEFKLVAKQSNAETENVTEDNTQITQETANTETDDSQNTTKNNDVVNLTATFVCKDIKLNIVETVEDNTNSSDTASTTESTTQSSSTATNGSTQTTN